MNIENNLEGVISVISYQLSVPSAIGRLEMGNFLSLGRLDMARKLRHPSTAFYSFERGALISYLFGRNSRFTPNFTSFAKYFFVQGLRVRDYWQIIDLFPTK
ncbi:MAG: hypothetical protein WBA93_20935 [Microcoleaceae cyanobacterium]